MLRIANKYNFLVLINFRGSYTREGKKKCEERSLLLTYAT